MNDNSKTTPPEQGDLKPKQLPPGVYYKIWISLEQITVYSDGNESYENMDESAMPEDAGIFTDKVLALQTMETISKQYRGEFL